MYVWWKKQAIEISERARKTQFSEDEAMGFEMPYWNN